MFGQHFLKSAYVLKSYESTQMSESATFYKPATGPIS